MNNSIQFVGIAQDVLALGHSLECQRVISLYTLMYEVQIGDLVNVLNQLARYRPIREQSSQEARILIQGLESVLHSVRSYSEILSFDDSLNHQIEQLQDAIDHDFPYGSLWMQIGILVDALHDGLLQHLRNKKFLFMPHEDVVFYESTHLFPNLTPRFDDAVSDAREAETAYAVRLYTACVFHSCRVAEHGLRFIAAKLDVDISDKGKVCPIEFGTWEKVLLKIEEKRIDLRKETKSTPLLEQQRYYAEAASHCSHIKDWFRNDVMHSRRSYSESEAMAALSRVAEFMTLLCR